jgi:hypothetical protein
VVDDFRDGHLERLPSISPAARRMAEPTQCSPSQRLIPHLAPTRS